MANGELPADTDVDQLTYDLTAFLVLAHSRLVFDGNDSGLAAGRAGRPDPPRPGLIRGARRPAGTPVACSISLTPV